jgi:hypothetical protein
MSDYEIAALFAQYASVLEDTFINFISVLFGFLIAGYLVASKLTTRMILLLMMIYTAFALNQIFTMMSIADDLRNLEGLIRERVANGAIELHFHSGGKNPLRGALLDVSAFISLIGGYLGSIWFFLNMRNKQSDSET